MKLICPECKNDVNLSQYPDLRQDYVLECDTCGISLMITNMDSDNLTAEVVDEGK